MSLNSDTMTHCIVYSTLEYLELIFFKYFPAAKQIPVQLWN